MNEQLVKLIDKHSYDGTLYSFGHLIYKETVCGPWVTFILSDGSEVYYETSAIPRSTPARVAPTPSGFPLTHQVPRRGLRPAVGALRMRSRSCGSGRRGGDGMAPNNSMQRTALRAAADAEAVSLLGAIS